MSFNPDVKQKPRQGDPFWWSRSCKDCENFFPFQEAEKRGDDMRGECLAGPPRTEVIDEDVLTFFPEVSGEATKCAAMKLRKNCIRSQD